MGTKEAEIRDFGPQGPSKCWNFLYSMIDNERANLDDSKNVVILAKAPREMLIRPVLINCGAKAVPTQLQI
jgi:hypothetical protein